MGKKKSRSARRRAVKKQSMAGQAARDAAVKERCAELHQEWQAGGVPADLDAFIEGLSDNEEEEPDEKGGKKKKK